MKSSILGLANLINYLGISGVLLLTLLGGYSIQAQQFPTILKKETSLSPRNSEEFAQLAAEYKKAVCFDSSENSTQVVEEEVKKTKKLSKGEQVQQEPSTRTTTITRTTECNGERAVQLRNALIYATLSQIDLNFTKYQRHTRRGKAIFETLMDFLVIAGDTAAIIANGARPKNIINASSALVQLSREKVDKNLRLAESQALFNKMETNRIKVSNDLRPPGLPRAQ